MNWWLYKYIISLSSELKKWVLAYLSLPCRTSTNRNVNGGGIMNSSTLQLMPSCKVGVNFQFISLHHWLVVRSQDCCHVTKSPAVSWSLQSHACFLPDYRGVLSSRWTRAVQSGLIIWIILTWTFDRVICAELQFLI